MKNPFEGIRKRFTRNTATDATRRRSKALPIVAGVATNLAAVALAFWLNPALRETPLWKAIPFPAPLPAPRPAVPPDQLAKEMERDRAANPDGAFRIDAKEAENLGIRTGTVETIAQGQTLRTTGRIVPDERRVTQVSTKVEGWIEETFANFEGQSIRKGQPLFTIYSPDLVATQAEYLTALRARKDFEGSEFQVVRDSGVSLLEATRRRLLRWDVTPAQIAELEKTGTPVKAITVYAAHSGVITDRKAYAGMRVTPDTALYMISDLDTVWVEADVFESDLALLRIGTPAELTLPDKSIRTARVAYINPSVSQPARTGRVRLELANRNLSLKPGMFVDVTFTTPASTTLSVPRDAVVETGKRSLVLVENAAGDFVLREIRTGERGLETTVVLSGITEGEIVVRNLQFYIDSETSLRRAVERAAEVTP